MNILKNLPNFLKQTIRQKHGGYIPGDAEFKILALGSPATVSPGDVTTKNTAMRYEVGDFTGVLLYDRVDATVYWDSMTTSATLARKLVIHATTVHNTHDLIDDINRYAMIGLTKDNTVSASVPAGNYTSFTVTLNNKHVWLTGSLTLPLEQPVALVAGQVITSVPVDSRLARYTYNADPIKDATRFPPGVLTWDTNFDTDAETLALVKIPVGGATDWSSGAANLTAADAGIVAGILKARDGLPWTYATSGMVPFNLYNVRTVFNGPVEDFINQNLLTWNAGHYGYLQTMLKKPRQDRQFVLALLPSSGNYTVGSSNFLLDLILIHYGPENTGWSEDKSPLHHWPLDGDRKNYGTDPAQPESAIRGHFVQYSSGAPRSLIVDGGDYNTNAHSLSPVGADVDISKDFTFCFDIADWQVTVYNASGYVDFLCAFDDNTWPAAGRLSITGARNAALAGTWDVAVENSVPSIQSGTGKVQIALVRKGDWWFIYANGQLAQINKGVHQLPYFNSLWVYSGYASRFSEIKIYDYALSGDQVRRQYEPVFYKPVEQAPEAPLPVPVHRWPLNNSLVDMGSDPKPLNSVFGFRQVGGAKPSKNMWAYQATTGSKDIGVPLPVDKDFTLCFDFFSSSTTQAHFGFLGDDGPAVTMGLRFYGTCPYLLGGVVYPSAVTDIVQIDNLWAVRVQMVRRGNVVAFYLNGAFLKAMLWPKGQVKPWSTFGKIGTVDLNSAHSFRNLTYYDVALKPNQLVEDATKDW